MARSEHAEAVELVKWLKSNGYKYNHCPSETYTTSWSQKRKNTAAGVVKGFPDYTIILKKRSLLFIELKKARGKRGGLNGSVISQEQLEWQVSFNNMPNIQCEFCHGAEEAINLIKQLELG